MADIFKWVLPENKLKVTTSANLHSCCYRMI